MMLKNTLLTISCAVFFFTQLSFGQQLVSDAARKRVSDANRIILNPKRKTVETVFLNDGAYDSLKLSQLNRQLFGGRAEDTWHFLRSEKDQIGMHHARYQQLYKGIPVEGCVYIYHYRNGFIQSANGDFFPSISVSTTPSITAENAFATALEHDEIKLKLESVQYQDIDLVILVQNEQPRLAYRCQVFSRSPLMNKNVYVDAISGKVLWVVSKICSNDAIGTGHTHFSGIQTVTTDSISPSNFRSTESGRGNGIITLNATTMNPYSDSDNNWNNVNPNQDQFAMDVHFGAEATYDFFMNNFNRDSYDNAAGVITSHVNDASVGVNAYWSGGPMNEMYYGNGDNNYFPVASLEVAGHELTHGVTEYAANLIYAGESGALNESFSDIFGNTIRFMYAPSVATWYIGDQLLRPGGQGDAAFRNMANPNEFQNADCYNGLFFNNGDIVHFDSGIQNYWYYLLCNGGTGTNDLGNNFAVTSIGMNDAMRIAYRNLEFYLTPNATFMDARLGSEQAAIDLFGLCSTQHLAVVHAWYAVGVGGNSVSQQVDAQFDVAGNFACVAPLSTSFTSNQGYESYAWDFGDGSTSTVQNPAHVYTANGNYTVTLIVTNTSVCPGSDTMVFTDAIVINPINPIANFSLNGPAIAGQPTLFTDISSYGPTSWQWSFGDGGTATVQNPSHNYANAGMYNVLLIVQNCAGTDTIQTQVEVTSVIIMCQQFTSTRSSGIIYDSGDENGTYQDNENCTLLIQPCYASSITVTMEELDIETGWDYLYIYDGINGNAPLLATFNGNNLQSPVTTTGGAVFIQFISDQSVIQSGYKMSYTSVLANNPGNNSALFTVSNATPQAGQLVTFTDQSANNPIAWSWNFGDGGTSTLQNPTHTYAANGNYTVTLTVTYCDNTIDSNTSMVFVGGVGLEENANTSESIIVFPNPSSDQFTVQNTAEWSQINLVLTDLSGRKVHETTMETTTSSGISVPVKGFVSGQYLLTIQYTNIQQEPVVVRRKIQIQ